MSEMSFTIHFHGPFHVAHGQAERGLDRPVDERIPLPASSLKGLLRAEALEQLGLNEDRVGTVFGTRRRACPWAFSDAAFTQRQTRRAARIKIEEDGLVGDRFLMLGEQVWARDARFSITQTAAVDDLAGDQLILTAAAQSVTSLGGNRRRGEGWVSIVRDAHSWSQADTSALLALMTAATA